MTKWIFFFRDVKLVQYSKNNIVINVEKAFNRMKYLFVLRMYMLGVIWYNKVSMATGEQERSLRGRLLYFQVLGRGFTQCYLAP